MTHNLSKNIFYGLIITSLLLIFGFSIIPSVNAQNASVSNIQYPVSELQNCVNKTECKSFCDQSENIDICTDFAFKYGLINQEQASISKKFSEIRKQGGPGGCTEKSECEAYCENLDNIEECLAFAEKHQIMNKEKLEDAKRIRQAIQNGIVPPGQCKNKDECEKYCSQADNIEECLAFAEKAGFLKDKKLTEAKKVFSLIKNGESPGNCTNKEECQTYCKDDSHNEECTNFALKAGLFNQEQAEISKKTGGKGPVGCQSKNECITFCSVPENENICLQFGRQNGLISEEDSKKIEKAIEKSLEMRTQQERMNAEIIKESKESLEIKINNPAPTNINSKESQEMKKEQETIKNEWGPNSIPPLPSIPPNMLQNKSKNQ